MSTTTHALAILTLLAVASCSERSPSLVTDDVPASDDINAPVTDCRLPRVICARRCVDPSSDPAHCGGCGVACAQGQVCAGGRCDNACPEGQFRCDDRCVPLAIDRANCGACGNACPAGRVCSQGRCELSCGPMYAACEAPVVDAGARDGGLASPAGPYCTDTRTDELNCGACGTRCPPGNLCAGGACALSCVSGQTRCGDVCADLQSSGAHCGACGAACAGAQRCVRGACEGSSCAAGQTLCGAVCASLRSSPEHCGACGNACGAQRYCEAGACVPNCRRGYTACGDVCADTQTDARHCGRCGAACPAGQSCLAGACALQCPFDRAPCGGACVDPSTDTRNCGGCGLVCPAGALCAGGACALGCGPSQTLCAGRCVNPSVDPAHCGACGLACAAEHACVGGRCAPLAGADASACPAPAARCGAACVDLSADNMHCGGCGRACGPARLCRDGMCVAPCAAGFVRCDGVCVNGLTSATNCGACGRACAAGESCVVGRCLAGPAPTRFAANLTPAGVDFVDACAAPGATRLLATSDEGEETLSIPFAFRYFTVDVAPGSPVVASVNGWLGLTGAPFGGRSLIVPSTAAPGLVVAAHAGDQQALGPLCVATLGAAPSRRWVVEWSENAERNTAGVVPGSSLTYEAIFSEASNTIDLVYEAVLGPLTNRYHGLEGPTGLSTGSTPGCTATSYVCTATAGQRVRFTPAP
jgi:hypothetical protein